MLTRRLLFEYTSTHTQVNQLCCVHHQACEASGAISHWPPLELTYSDFSLTADPANWRSFDALQGPINSQGYQLVDLYRDGLPGVLYRSDKSWYYREPLRAPGRASSNALIYGPWQALPRTPLADTAQATRQAGGRVGGIGRLTMRTAHLHDRSRLGGGRFGQDVHARFGISEYCGCIAYWVVLRHDIHPGQEGLAQRWVDQIAVGFKKRFATLVRLDVFSNGEAIFERTAP